jgi:DNA-binding transcriptional LysR family regulator
MLSVTLRQLEYAVAVARHGGVTAAAAALHVSQPALSVALANLEHDLGKPLFLRRRNGPMVPTSFGRAFLDDAARHLAGVAQLMQGEGAGNPPVRLACFADLAPVLLAPLLRRLGQALPGIAVTPLSLGFEPLADGLLQGQIDLAITYDLGLDTGFLRHELMRIAPHAVLAATHPLAAGETVSLADLAAEPLILADQGLSLGHMRALFGHQGLNPTIAHRTATLELMRSFAANGLGVGLSYTRPAPDQSYDGRALALRPVRDAGPGEPVVLVQARANPLSHAAVQVADWITAQPFPLQSNGETERITADPKGEST